MGAPGPGPQRFLLGYFGMPSRCCAQESLPGAPASPHRLEGELGLVARALSCCLGSVLASLDHENEFSLSGSVEA